MATSLIDLSSEEWTRLTNPGKSGTCWKRQGDFIVVSGTDQEITDTLPLSNLNVTVEKSKRVPLDRDSNAVLILNGLSSSTVYYALSIGESIGKIVIDSFFTPQPVSGYDDPLGSEYDELLGSGYDDPIGDN